jgi:hypothetical protein
LIPLRQRTTDAGEEILRVGDAHLQNRSEADAELLEIGSRVAGDAVTTAASTWRQRPAASRRIIPTATARRIRSSVADAPGSRSPQLSPSHVSVHRCLAVANRDRPG